MIIFMFKFIDSLTKLKSLHESFQPPFLNKFLKILISFLLSFEHFIFIVNLLIQIFDTFLKILLRLLELRNFLVTIFQLLL